MLSLGGALGSFHGSRSTCFCLSYGCELIKMTGGMREWEVFIFHLGDKIANFTVKMN